MTLLQLQAILVKGESSTVEFKTCRNKLNKDAFDSICAFLNRSGGHLLLGINDKKEITGVDEGSIPGILDTIVVNANNSQKLNPPYYLSPHVVDVEGKKVISIYVPESSQVHSTAGKIFDRNEDGDFNITNHPDLVTQLYLKKQKSYSENQVFPFVQLSDFKSSLFDRVRALVRNQRPNHPWLELNNEELMKSAGLYKKDMQTGREGFTLAGILLLGKEELILNVLPHHKTDAILRVENEDRYDDRDDVRLNLIDSYDHLMGFISKHLPEKFHLDGDQRINVRDKLFREIVGNLLVHREYVSPFPAKLIIDKFKVSTENWNKSHSIGNIDPNNFSPFPKNPMIARFFKEIGWVDELGSGVRNMYKFCELYTPETHPIFIEGDVFKAIIPLDKTTTQVATQVATQVTTQVTTQMTTQMESQKITESILELLIENPELSRKNLTDLIGEITEDGVRYHLDKLKKEGRIQRSGTTNGHWIVILDKEKTTTQVTTQVTTQDTTQVTTQMDSQNVQNRILELLIKTPTLSRKDVSELLGDITEDGVKYHLDKLKQEGILKREGTTRGSWTIILKK